VMPHLSVAETSRDTEDLLGGYYQLLPNYVYNDR